MRMLLILPVWLASVVFACSSGDDHFVFISSPSVKWPVADSPIAVGTVLKAAMMRRDAAHYTDLFASNFVFEFAAADGGDAQPQTTWTRDQEREFANHLFVTGTADARPASGISVILGDLRLLSDPRPGKSAEAHVVVEARITLDVRTPTRGYRGRLLERFYCVRGDSAAESGFGAARDKNRWYIERWEEPSTPDGALSWSRLKEIYR